MKIVGMKPGRFNHEYVDRLVDILVIVVFPQRSVTLLSLEVTNFSGTKQKSARHFPF